MATLCNYQALFRSFYTVSKVTTRNYSSRVAEEELEPGDGRRGYHAFLCLHI